MGSPDNEVLNLESKTPKKAVFNVCDPDSANYKVGAKIDPSKKG